jgi:phosphoribosylanthranilate isomerase
VSSDLPVAIRCGAVKVCGLRRPEDAVTAVAAGADMASMVFAPSRRQITPAEGRAISEAVRARSSTALTVGVFVDASVSEITGTVAAADLDVVQLSGDEPTSMPAALGVPVIRALQALPGESADTVAARARAWLEAPVPPVALLVDGYHPTARGGTGIQADWGLVGELQAILGQPVGLAGGLTPENVGVAVGEVGPLFVDVSGGVERDGVKDPARITAFVHAALGAFGRR